MNPTNPIRVLLLEDNESDAFLVRAALSPRSKFEILHVETLEQARDALSNHARLDIVVGDLNLPDSGQENTLEFLLRTREKLPVIVLNACDDPELERRCAARGAVCYSKQKLLEPAFVDTMCEQIEHVVATPSAD